MGSSRIADREPPFINTVAAATSNPPAAASAPIAADDVVFGQLWLDESGYLDQ
jgi:hypothetical protein